METVKQKGNYYHLLIEDFGSNLSFKELNSDSSPATGDFITIEIADKGGLLMVDDNCVPRIVGRPYHGEDNIFIFQPIWNNSDSHLLMACPGRKRPIINAIPAPSIALLKVKDDILFPNAVEFTAHVSLYTRPRLGPVPDNRAGRKCPLCRSTFLKNTLTYTCYRCGQAIHYKRNGHAESDGLDCANICDNCPVCRARIYLNDGFVYLPEYVQKQG
jgi:hypothetical protein